MTDALLRQLLDDAVNLCVVLDRDGSVIYTNHAFERLLNSSRTSRVGKSIFPIIHPNDVDALRRSLQQALTEPGVKLETTFRIGRSPTEWRILEAVYWAVVDEGAEPRVLVSAQDATKRVEAQQLLREREDQLSRAQRVAKMGSWELNLTTGELVASRQLFRLYGLKPCDSIPFQELRAQFHPDDVEHIDEAMRRAQQTMGTFELDHRIIRKDGVLRMMHVRGETEMFGKDFIMYGTAQDVTEQHAAERELKRSRQELRHLTSQLHRVQEEERARLAREVHDVLGQAMTALRLDVHWLKEKGPLGDESFQERAQKTLELVEETIGTIRRISHELRPGVLDHFGLAAAVEWLVEEYQTRSELTFEVVDEAGACLEGLEPDLATALFRIFQEAITNVVRHAEATSVQIRLSLIDRQLVLTISDDGKGISEEDIEQSTSLGILNMRERVLPWKGRVTISGAPGSGTIVRVSVPVP